MSNAYIGEIRLVGFNFAPRGWALCNGATLAISQNAALFSLLGTNFGGNGTTTFQLPDLRSRLPIGMGQGTGLSSYNLGQVSGAEHTTIGLSNMPPHNHAITGNVTVATTVQTYSKVGNQPSPAAHVLAKGEAATTPVSICANYSDQTPDTSLGGVASIVTSNLGTALIGSGLPVSILPPYLAINYVVVLQGLFPSRN